MTRTGRLSPARRFPPPLKPRRIGGGKARIFRSEKQKRRPPEGGLRDVTRVSRGGARRLDYSAKMKPGGLPAISPSCRGWCGGERSSLALRPASVCTRQHHKRASLEFNVSSLQGWDQTLRLSLALLNHKTRIAPTTTTNKIVSFIWLHRIIPTLCPRISPDGKI